MKLCVIWSFLSHGQSGLFKAGISIDFGNEVKRIGLRFDANLIYTFMQTNIYSGFYYNFSSWGVQSKTPEIKIGGAAHFGMGKKDNEINPFINVHESNLPHDFVIGYAYQYYFDRQSTSQATGIIVTSYKNFSILTENDLLGAGKGWRDRFRTGALKVNYRYLDFKLGFSVQLYTGDYASCSKITDDNKYPARYGYRSQDKAIHGSKSLGILSLQAEYSGPYYQSARMDIGLNSEKVRHVIQNKGMHDMLFYTDKKVKRQLTHIPMLQADGTIFSFKKGQTIKPTTFFWNMSLNPSAFY